MDNPNLNNFNELLQNIEAKLRSIMDGINEAVSNTTLGRPSNRSANVSSKQVPFYDTFKALDQDQKDAIYNILIQKTSGPRRVTEMKDYLEKQSQSQARNVGTEQSINSFLEFYFNKDGTTLTEKQRGGKRKRKTMKKRTKKTRKLMKKYQKGGYTYSASKELDKASVIVSDASGSNSGSNSNFKTRITPKTHNKKKSRKRSRK